MTSAMLARFRRRWLKSALPMLVEHRHGAPERVCPAPSLWLGGLFVGRSLAGAGLRRGATVRFTGTSRIGWAQTLLGCLQAGLAFDGRTAHPGAHGVGAHGVDAHGVDAHVDDALEVSVCGANRLADEGARILFDDVILTDADVAALATDGATLLSGLSARLGTAGAWGDWRRMAIELLGGLSCGLEIHVIPPDLDARLLAARRCTPRILVVVRPLSSGGIPADDIEVRVDVVSPGTSVRRGRSVVSPPRLHRT